MNILQTKNFKNSVKRLRKNQKESLDNAVKEIAENPLIGEQKKGDLASLRVYKFRMIGQLTLLAYSLDDNTVTLTLISIGSHENFYRDLKH